MNLISGIDVTAGALAAQKTRLDIVAQNIANAQTTRMAGTGGPFQRQMAVFRGEPFRLVSGPRPQGVRVERIANDPSPPRMVFDPSHPDANEEGYVQYPNIDIAVEMADLIAAQRAYESNLAVMASGKRMNERVLDIMEV